jgi:16S rRNA (cytosine1402-N4)-methyltransferase
MDTGSEDAQTAADIVNTYGEEDLANLIYKYGQERLSRRIAKAIVLRRAQALFTRTQDLADTIRCVMPKKPGDKIDPATRTFQALRIAVNDELGELSRALEASEDILEEDGRLVVVSFHSLEDGTVKSYLKEKSGGNPAGSRHLPEVESNTEAVFTLPKRNKTVKPSKDETQINPRARSARLRYALRLPLKKEGF